jgi:hypothetical protein
MRRTDSVMSGMKVGDDHERLATDEIVSFVAVHRILHLYILCPKQMVDYEIRSTSLISYSKCNIPLCIDASSHGQLLMLRRGATGGADAKSDQLKSETHQGQSAVQTH